MIKRLKTIADRVFFKYMINKRMNKDFFFVQIGACDGKQFDPIYKQVKSKKLSGILVEPVPYLFARLKNNYANQDNLFFENSAITTENGNIEMYTISEEGLDKLPAWAIGISSIHENKNSIGEQYWKSEKAQVHKAKGIDYELIEKYKLKIKVNAMNLNTLFDKYNVANIDLMVLDTEGHEYEILKQLKTVNTLPKLLRFEMNNIVKELPNLYKMLDDLGYKRTIINGYDCIAWL